MAKPPRWKNRIVGYGEEPVTAVIMNPKNWRGHPKYQQNVLEGILSEVGIVQNVIINRTTGNLIDGHLRVSLAIRNKEQSLPVTYVELSESEEAIILATIDPVSTLAETNPEQLDLLLHDVHTGNEFIMQMLDDLAQASGIVPGDEPGSGGDEFDTTPEIEGPTRCQLGDLWMINDKHRVIIGDSTDPQVVNRLMREDSPFIMVTDPPYGVEYDPEWRNEAAKSGHLAYAAIRVGKVANDDRDDWAAAYALSRADVVYCWHAHRHASSVQRQLESAGFELRSQIIWAKSNFPISRGHYHWRHEPCWYCVRKGATARWAGDRTQTTLWEINLDKNVEGGHSTQKPIECMARPIRNHGSDGDIVYDPFLGSGTTLIAAHRTGRRCYGCEIEPRYGDVILRRAEAEGMTVVKEV